MAKYWACFELTEDDGKKTRMRREVERFGGDDWDALVVDEEDGCLKPASSYSNFLELEERDDDFSIVAVVPGNGWLAEFSHDDGTTSHERIVCFGVSVDGYAFPLAVEDDGTIVCKIEHCSNFSRVVHESEVANAAAAN